MRLRASLALGGILASAVLLTACTSIPEVDLPDLAALGLDPVSCEDTVQMAGIAAEGAESQLECWAGSPESGYIVTAESILALLVDSTGGDDVSEALCWEDTLTDTEGSACRAVLVGSTEDGAVVSAVVALEDPSAVTGDLGDAPSDDEVAAAISGADIEVLVFSEPARLETQQ
ncbi:hypothetical protein [Demequina sp.]|uniref:hypothetical protein n=1 Tax=Demequina sp. TaxID=2050685 RepID=UPI0025D1125F|nr:hypothetical protein [Demequina sp.]